jgi:tRNA U34 5-methylaminomethyl-2-thiouridine-forming methyltransferase MnmC
MSTWTPQPTQDGSYTFFSPEFGESFHSCLEGAKTEAFQKFADATDLPRRAQQGRLRLLDVCYGLGYNTAAALATIWQANPNCQVELWGLELDPTVPLAAATPELLQCWPDKIKQVLTTLAHHHRDCQDHLTAYLLIGDARQTIQQVQRFGSAANQPNRQPHRQPDRQPNHQLWQADAIFFDPFSPRCCPQLWTVEFFQQVARCLAPQGKLATYSRSAAVRSALLQAELAIGSMPLRHQPSDQRWPHQWSQGTVAAWDTSTLPPLSVMEQEHLQTRAAIPYRDPMLQDPADVILQRHDREQQLSTAESTSSWRRRWGIR